MKTVKLWFSILFVALILLSATNTSNANAAEALFQWELDQNLTDAGTMGQALTDQAAITYAAGEPDPPGHGTHGAIFDGSSDRLSLANTVIGDRACNGTDHEATFYAEFTPNSVLALPQYVIAKYAATSGGRQLAPIVFAENGDVGFLWGYDAGNSYQSVKIADKQFEAEHLSVALSIDVAAKTYTLLVREWDTGTYWVKTEADDPLTGTYHPGTQDLMIGARSDSARFFGGTIWRVAIYDERHSRQEMEAIIENNHAPTDADSDGLPDLWELQYGALGDIHGRNANDDGDGISNWVEYKLGTNPLAANATAPGIYYQYDKLGRIKKIERIPSR